MSCKYLIRNSSDYTITSLNLGININREQVVLIGEINEQTLMSRLSLIEISTEKEILLFNEKSFTNNIILTSSMLNYSSYCISLSRKFNLLKHSDNKQSNSNQHKLKSNSNNIEVGGYQQNNDISYLGLWKYNKYKFISETKLNDTIHCIANNPNNSSEIILCGKGYLRLWNIFINEGSLKEHPQKFLNSKKEGDLSFIKVEFFNYSSNKSYSQKSTMFIAGTLENRFFIIKGFKVTYELEMNVDPYDCIDMCINLIPSENKDIKIYSNFKETKDKNISKKKEVSSVFSSSKSLLKNSNTNNEEDNQENDNHYNENLEVFDEDKIDGDNESKKNLKTRKI